MSELGGQISLVNPGFDPTTGLPMLPGNLAMLGAHGLPTAQPTQLFLTDQNTGEASKYS